MILDAQLDITSLWLTKLFISCHLIVTVVFWQQSQTTCLQKINFYGSITDQFWCIITSCRKKDQVELINFSGTKHSFGMRDAVIESGVEWNKASKALSMSHGSLPKGNPPAVSDILDNLKKKSVLKSFSGHGRRNGYRIWILRIKTH